MIGLGLLSTLVFGSVATAAPMPFPQGPIPKPSTPIPGNPIPVDLGVTTPATLTPRGLFDAGVSMDVWRPARVEGSKNRVAMTKHTQLVLQFKAAASKGYSIDCKFSGNPTVNIMEFANGSMVRQSSSNPAAGTLNHTISSTGSVREIKMYYQARGQTDWSECKINPS